MNMGLTVLIVIDNPSAAELAEFHKRSGLPVRRLFNTSGVKYRELGIKAKLDVGMSDDGCYELLAADGMLVKRPLLVVQRLKLVNEAERGQERRFVLWG